MPPCGRMPVAALWWARLGPSANGSLVLAERGAGQLPLGKATGQRLENLVQFLESLELRTGRYGHYLPHFTRHGGGAGDEDAAAGQVGTRD